MAYQVTLNGTQQLTIINRGIQTQITLMMSSAGQQQSQGSSLTTGTWVTPPKLFNTGQGFILQIDSDRGQHFIQIQSNSISTINGIPTAQNVTPIELENIADPPQNPVDFEPMQPMQPMQPMKMGNMSMDINSMSMQMGNMSMNLGNKSRKTSTTRFCSQCGSEAKPSDRFCSSCGHDLNN